MKTKMTLIIMSVCLCLVFTACGSSKVDPESTKVSNDDLKTDMIIDKNLKLEAPNIFVIDGKDMDEFWDSYFSETDIENEWFHASDSGYNIAIFGALKENPKQGVVCLLTVNPDYTVSSTEQILSPYEGGSLSVIDQTSIAKEFNMEVQEESGLVYLFNFYNGFIAYKKDESGDWKYWKT